MRYFKLEGLLILESSKNCYHVIFDKKVSWSENLSIVGRVVLMTQYKLLQKWHLMQCIKQSMTIRVSPKGDKPSPRIVCREGNQDEQIMNFLFYRVMIKRIIKKACTLNHNIQERNINTTDLRNEDILLVG